MGNGEFSYGSKRKFDEQRVIFWEKSKFQARDYFELFGVVCGFLLIFLKFFCIKKWFKGLIVMVNQTTTRSRVVDACAMGCLLHALCKGPM